MHTITINLSLDDEQHDALQAFTDEWNGENGTSTIADCIKADAIDSFIASKVEAAYHKAVAQLGQDARALPYNTRKQLITQVREQIHP